MITVNLTWIDWAVVVIAFSLMLYGVMLGKKFMHNVADFLAAGRSAGRYLISVAMGMSMLGAITIVGEFQIFYKSGFCMKFWELSMSLAILIVTVSGWVIYRFRQTRSLTLAQFFEARYSRNFRVFAGLVAYLSGLINFGIFPSVGANFFIYYCDFPLTFSLLGIEFSTYAVSMIILLLISLYFVFAGGQVAVIIADFIQGVFTNAVFVIILIYLVFVFDWNHISHGLSFAPENASLINPFKTSQVEDFNFWYFIIGLIGIIYCTMSWQGSQAYNTSARSAHEAKMAQVLSNWRNFPRNIFLMFVPVIAFMIMNHVDFAPLAQNVNAVLSGVDSNELKSQLTVPLVLLQILPVGLIGAFAAVMLAAFIGTHDTYLHSWGTIFIQDVIMPFRKKPFKKEQHLNILRYSIVGVAVFIFFFSLIFKQSQHIYLFFAITGAIFTGGSGAVIIGGLYWKRGTTAAAWSAMLTGSTIAVGGIIIHQIYEGFFINGQWFWGIAMVASTIVYIAVSLLGKQKVYNLDKLLHRGEYEIKDEMQVIDTVPSRGWKMLGMGKEFTKGDKFIYILSYTWIFIWTGVFIIGTIYNLAHPVTDSIWMTYWKYYVYIYIIASAAVVVWFSIGGFIDLKMMFKRLSTMERDDQDDGFLGERS
jgi:SSS family solute:Na+ symporter